MSIKLAGRSTCARAFPCVGPTGCTYTHARAMQFLYGRTYGRTYVRTYGRRVNHVTTKFSRLHGLLPFSLDNGCSAPRAFGPLEELRYNGFIKTILLTRIIPWIIERFSIECRKTKTKVITTANQNKDKYHKEPIRTQSKYT